MSISPKNTKTNQRGFAITPNELLNDSSITLMAKGIYGFMQSKPDGWNFTILSMSKQLKEGTQSISTSLRQLKDSGWIEYTKHQDGSGHYSILTDPKPGKQVLDSCKGFKSDSNELSPCDEIPRVGKRKMRNPACISKKEPLVRKIDKKKEGVSKRFSPPTLDEIVAHPKCPNKEFAERFYYHYESNGWQVGKSKMKNWVAALAGWVSRDKAKHVDNGQLDLSKGF